MSVSMATLGARVMDKVVIVTGGTRGIGEGIVREFVKNGAKVIFCGKEADLGAKLEAELNESGPGHATMVSCDVTKEEDIKHLVMTTVALHGRVDCLVNNAGWHPPPQLIDDITADEFRSLLDLNLIGYFLSIKYALPHLRQHKGCVINISSLVDRTGQEGAVPYTATKGAITAMTKALAIDEAKNHVRVNAISPGAVYTPLWDDIFEQSGLTDKEAYIKAGQELQLLGRYGTPKELGKLCVFLASDATFITGVAIPFSGGAELGYASKTKVQPNS